jgi:hypothetical protein
MRFLLLYSDPYEARTNGWPPGGSVLEAASLDDLIRLSERFGNSRLILDQSCNAQNYAPFWLDNIEAGLFDDCDRESYHTVSELPDDWRDLRVIEVYNGRRE